MPAGSTRCGDQLACRSSKPCPSRDVSGDDGEGDPADGTRTPRCVADGATIANRARHAPWPRAVRAALARDSTDERPDLRIDEWTSGSLAALPGPVELESLAMPADHGLWLHDDQGVLPVGPQTAESGPECAINLRQLGALGLALHNRQLLSQGEVLESEFALRLQARCGGREQGVQQVKHGGGLARPERANINDCAVDGVLRRDRRWHGNR